MLAPLWGNFGDVFMILGVILISRCALKVGFELQFLAPLRLNQLNRLNPVYPVLNLASQFPVFVPCISQMHCCTGRQRAGGDPGEGEGHQGRRHRRRSDLEGPGRLLGSRAAQAGQQLRRISRIVVTLDATFAASSRRRRGGGDRCANPSALETSTVKP